MVKCLTLDFGQGHDLTILSSSPALSLPGIFSPPPSQPLPCSHSLPDLWTKTKQNKTKQTKKAIFKKKKKNLVTLGNSELNERTKEET